MNTVVERRAITSKDVLDILPILTRNQQFLRDFARATQAGDPEAPILVFLEAVGFLPDLVPWIASLYGKTAEEVLAEPPDRFLDYLEGIVRGEDAAAFFKRLGRLLGMTTGSTGQ